MAMRVLRLLLCCLVLAGPAWGQGVPEQRVVVDNTEVYYGIVPAEIARAQQGKDAKGMGLVERLRKRRHQKHVVVALFDTRTGERIVDARVSAIVTPLGMGARRSQLKPVRIGEVTSYGAFFDFPPDGAPYKVELDIARSGHPPSRVSFDYTP